MTINDEMPTISTVRAITIAASDLGRDGVLNDPTDAEIMLAAVELSGREFDISQASRFTWQQVIAAWEAGAGREEPAS